MAGDQVDTHTRHNNLIVIIIKVNNQDVLELQIQMSHMETLVTVGFYIYKTPIYISIEIHRNMCIYIHIDLSMVDILYPNNEKKRCQY